jgi:catechol 2,3-dioxygenase
MTSRSIGHVHLKVSDLRRSEAFYRDVLGFEPRMRYGEHISFLAFDDEYHHHLALNDNGSAGVPGSVLDRPGILHFAILFETREALADAARRVVSNGVDIVAANDHGNSIGLYLRDPDAIEIELTWDREPAEWPRDDQGEPIPSVTPLDLAAFLA